MTDTDPPEPSMPPRDKPRIKIVPPKIAGMFLLVGIFFSFVAPLPVFSFWTSLFVGLLVFVPAGAAIAWWGFHTFAEHKTDFRIDRPASCVVKTGPYAFSRNPIYVGGALLYIGIALLFNAGWAVLGVIPLMYIIHQRVVLPEEEYLEKKFGQEYRDYKAKVKRWL
jgi:protein-S-isoprenylcysteine O-methyltransferase Ste14